METLVTQENLKKNIEQLEEIKKILKNEIIELDDEILFQDFGLYRPQYDFADSEGYKEALKEVRLQQKSMIKMDLGLEPARKTVIYLRLMIWTKTR